MRSCRRSLTQYFDQQQERRRKEMGSASVANSNSNSYGWCSSGYGTCSSLSDDDLLVHGEDEERDSIYSERSMEKGGEMGGREDEKLHPGICPHCKHIYKKPLTLQCGHSLCSECCADLLSRMETTSSVPRIRPRMGISSYSRSSLNKTLTASWSNVNGVFSVWKSPRCTVCGESPKKIRPVPNLTLEAFLTTIRLPPSLRHLYDGEGSVDDCVASSVDCTPLSISKLLLPLSTQSELGRVSIKDCTISIVGSKGVGKSSLLQSQLCNDMLVNELLGRKGMVGGDSPLSLVSSIGREKGGVTYMLKMVESGEVGEKVSFSMGIVVMYSIVDRESFHDAMRLLSVFTTQRGTQMPMIVVGSKSDLEKRRVVHSYEGQQLAKQFDCPFIEVSSRRNECVNEAFIELVRVMESRCLFN